MAREYLRETFNSPPLSLDPERHEQMLDPAVRRGIRGGAIYDAVVASTAKQVGATLLTLDQRAVGTYRLMDTDYVLIQ